MGSDFYATPDLRELITINTKDRAQSEHISDGHFLFLESCGRCVSQNFVNQLQHLFTKFITQPHLSLEV